MEDTAMILFVPLCAEGELDVDCIRGLLDVLAMNLQSYPGIYVKAPLFVVDAVDEETKAPVRKILLWSSSYREEELMEIIRQCGPEISAVLIPAVKGTGQCMSLQIKVLNLTGNFEIYNETWEGSLLKITHGISSAAGNIVKGMEYNVQGQEKWPFTSNEEALKRFLQGVASAALFQAGIDQSDFRSIVNNLLRAFQMEPTLDLAAYRLLGFIESLIRNPDLPAMVYKDALAILKQMEAMLELPGPAHLMIAEIYASLEKWEKTEDNLRRAFRKTPENGEVVAALGNYYEGKRHWKKAKEVYEYHLAKCARPSYLVVHNLGAIYAEEGKLEKAVSMWCRTLSYQANYSSAYGNLMNAYLEMKQYGKMWVVFEEGLKYKPVAWYSYEHFIRNLDKVDNYGFAIEALHQYIERHPQDQGGYYYLGLAFLHVGERRKAVKVLEKGLQLSRDREFSDAITHQLLRLKIENFEEKFDRACRDVMRGKALDSISFFKECNSCVSSFWQAWFLLGKAHQRLEQYSQALKAMKHAHELAPEHSDILNELGIIATLVNDHRYAQECFHKAVLLQPLQADYLSNLALSLIKEGDYERARQIIYRALAIKPNDRIAQTLLNLLDESVYLDHDNIFPHIALSKKRRKKKKRKPKKQED